MRGGTLVVRGDAGARPEASMKGGTLLIGGDCGYMTDFMGQKGAIIVCGSAEPGSDAELHETTPDEEEYLSGLMERYRLAIKNQWKKAVAGRRLWNFDKREDAWRTIL